MKRAPIELVSAAFLTRNVKGFSWERNQLEFNFDGRTQASLTSITPCVFLN